jgi:hypothetical protein
MQGYIDLAMNPLLIAKNIGKLWLSKLATSIRRTSYAIDQIIRIISMQFVLTPAAYILPRKIAFALANALALLLIILPKPGFSIYRQMHRAFRKSRIASFCLACGWLSRPLYDYVVLKRIIYGRENPDQWRIVERNADYVSKLRENGDSYIIATAHYAKGPLLCMLSPNVTYGRIILVGDPPRKSCNSLYKLRIYIQYGTLVRAISHWCGRNKEVVHSGTNLNSARNIHRFLREKGNVVSIAVDALWHKTLSGSYERPFAGQKSRVFATGAAALARAARCPIISCVHILESDGTMVLEWGEPILTNDYEVADDVSVMNKLLDTVEVAIGERPTQYIYEIGRDRFWNRQMRRWEDITE